jgi:hypothetical protein
MKSLGRLAAMKRKPTYAEKFTNVPDAALLIHMDRHAGE